MPTSSTAIDWITAGRTPSVDALVLRFATVMNGLHDQVETAGATWFIADVNGRLIDCSSENATPLLGSPVSQLVGGLAAGELVAAWAQVQLGRAQTIWPWRGGRAKVTMRSIELHPLRDVMSEVPAVIGALVVMVDARSDVHASRTSVAA